ncbi:hypothetical protein B296_00005546 [Ensete ventricosum]|uniref:Uncharacterized protein n=1 Tax=Ensete ventricosum TaxID=4639 RepID=A0A426YAQ8_ENSVE|nr:hypothetical protein B296_00005546 [Ensete ventricosum]
MAGPPEGMANYGQGRLHWRSPAARPFVRAARLQGVAAHYQGYHMQGRLLVGTYEQRHCGRATTPARLRGRSPAGKGCHLA